MTIAGHLRGTIPWAPGGSEAVSASSARRGLAQAVSRLEGRALGLFFSGLMILRVLDVFRRQPNTDEPQHLHIAWAWTQGLVQYRDVFDNHAPLFHLAMAPVMAAIGERADVIEVARLAMLPLFVAALWLTCDIGRQLFGWRVGLWAALLVGLHKHFFFSSLEVRADDLWLVLCLLSVRLVLGANGALGAFAAGLLLGAALCTSLKTLLLAGALGGAALLLPLAGARTWIARPGRALGALLAGVAVLPLAVVLGFAHEGALRPLFYCTVTHNLGAWAGGWWRVAPLISVPPVVALLVLAAGPLARTAGCPARGARRVFLFFVVGLYLLFLLAVWRVTERQTFLPLDPLVSVFVAAALVHLPGFWVRAAPPVVASALLVSLAAFELAGLVAAVPPWHPRPLEERALVGDVLRLTSPSDYVLDAKGETIFRRRPYYFALETFTNFRLRRGELADRIPEACIATGTPVVMSYLEPFPPRTRAFVRRNYLPIGRVRVAGRWIARSAPNGEPAAFEVEVPARYAIVGEDGAVEGTLDGTPYTGPRRLAAGPHVFAGQGTGRLALVWARAVERGFSPFGKRAGASR